VETKKKLPEQMESYDCALRARDYIRVLTADQHAAARDCLEKTVANDPHYPLAWTLLSLVYQNEYFFEHNPKPDSINRAVQAARRGMEGDPNVATVALARALYAKQDPAFFDYAERAIAMNPLDADTLAQLGMNMAWAGHWERGIEFARKALALDPNLPGWAYIPLQTYHYRKREYDRALEYARKIDVQYFWSWVHLAIDYAQLGRTAEARSAAAEILRLYPTFPQNARREIHKWIWEKEFADHMIDGLRKAGLDIPSEEAVVR
jgi:adenylate cyclase